MQLRVLRWFSCGSGTGSGRGTLSGPGGPLAPLLGPREGASSERTGTAGPPPSYVLSERHTEDDRLSSDPVWVKPLCACGYLVEQVPLLHELLQQDEEDVWFGGGHGPRSMT